MNENFNLSNETCVFDKLNSLLKYYKYKIKNKKNNEYLM